MMSDVFQFKQFAVCQRRSAMKVGTDGVLLGAWCDADGVGRALDVGCGTGLISLMLAQKSPSAVVDAIDLDAIAVGEASANFVDSPWSERLRAACVDYVNFTTDVPYDLIVSNPPFFVEKVLSPERRRSCARQCDSLPFDVLFGKSYSLLNDAGRFAIITPTSIDREILFAAGEANFWVKKRTYVKTKAEKPAKRILWEFVKTETVPQSSELVLLNADGSRSETYTELTKDFYIK
ncbi:MAG: tRNA1(Val) (adenine(37)-N6)-methyltransferase [Candidatus Limisoma sp.]